MIYLWSLNNIYSLEEMNSSELTKKRNSRILYADYMIQKQKFENGCSMRIQIGSGSGNTNASSSLLNIYEGEVFTTPSEQQNFLSLNACPVLVQNSINVGGSMRFVGGGLLAQTNVSYPNDAALRPGTGAFTIEWFQYYQDSDTNAIVFSIGTFGTGGGNDLCIVYTGTTLFLFTDGSSSNVASAVTKNQWQHIAVVGNGGADGSRNTKVYVDGVLKLTRTSNYNINQTENLRIGNQTDASVLNGNYAGLITNFRWVVGSQVYTSDFIKPSSPLSAISGTQLLLSALNSSDVVKDSSPANRSPTNTGVVFDTSTPFS
jgi:hypothetical protein